MENEAVIQVIANEMGLVLSDKSHSDNIQQLTDKINALLATDFDRLISILYRMDVSEVKLKQLLKDNPAEDAARIIAALMIERQAEKIKSRRQFSKRDDNIDENEKW
ncbi:MAG: hypothetical protein WDO16_04310 [Bacteroidota bacterium]